MFCIGDLETIVTTPTGVPLIAIFQNATGSVKGALGLTSLITVIALVSLWFLMAQSSRVIFSFARDNGLPFSSYISRVHPTLHVPIYSILLVLVINMALMALYFGTVEGFGTVLAISTEAFCALVNYFDAVHADLSADLSYIMPLVVRILSRFRGQNDIDSAYSLGRYGMACNVVGLVYLCFGVVTFNFPSVRYPHM